MTSVLDQLIINRANHSDKSWDEFLKTLLNKSIGTNYYDLMGVKADCKIDITSLKKKYKELCLLLHPDKNRYKCYQATAEELFKLIKNAYAVLSDPEQEKDYYQQLNGFYQAAWRSHKPRFTTKNYCFSFTGCNTTWNTEYNRDANSSPSCFSFFSASMKEQANKEPRTNLFDNSQKQTYCLPNLFNIFCF